MKKVFLTFVSSALIIFGMSSLSVVAAATCPFGGSPNWQGVCDTTTDSGQEYHGPTMTEEEAKTHTENNTPQDNSNSSVKDSLVNSTNTTSNITVSNNEALSNDNQNLQSDNLVSQPRGTFIPLTPEYNDSAWAVIDKDNNVLNIISCSILTCGSENWHKKAIEFGIFPEGSKLIFQKWAEKNGNVSGYINANYNESNKIWTVVMNDSVYQIPTNSEDELVCIENCVTLENNENIVANNNVVIEENIVPMIFSTQLKPNTFATIIAKNKNKTKIWKTKVNKNGKIKININKKYKKWKFKVKVGS